MQRVLFVDDEVNVLNGLKRLLHAERAQWDMQFESSASSALALMEKTGPVDVLVTDLQMPVMDGLELLRVVAERYPDTVRFCLSGTARAEMLMQATALTHQMLTKPCDTHQLRVAIARAIAMRDHLSNRRLKQTLLALGSLPALPAMYQEIMNALYEPDASIKAIGAIIERDVAMSAKVLQIVNSALMGLPNHVSSVTQAVGILGLENLKHLILMLEVFAPIEDISLPGGFSIQRLWRHSLDVGALAKRIAEADDASHQTVQEAFTAGLLHDVGQLILATRIPGDFATALEYSRFKNISIFDAEKKIFGATHAEVGGFLLELWGLPDSIVSAVTFHEFPSGVEPNGFCAVTAVHAANYLLAGGPNSSEQAELDTVHMDRLDLTGRVGDWCDLAADLL